MQLWRQYFTQHTMENDKASKKGYFVELLHLTGKFDQTVRYIISDNPCNAKYTDHEIQDERLEIMANMIRDQMSCEVRDAKLFARTSAKLNKCLWRSADGLDALRETQPHSPVLLSVVMACVSRKDSAHILHSAAHTPPKSCFGRLKRQSEKQSQQGNFVLLSCETCTLFFFPPAYLSTPLSLKSKVNLSNHNSQLDLRNTLIRDRHAVRLCVSSAKKKKKTLSAINADLMDILPQPKFTQIRCRVRAPPD